LRGVRLTALGDAHTVVDPRRRQYRRFRLMLRSYKQ
jgi:hypothetical protein